jgi:hypothetical protein
LRVRAIGGGFGAGLDDDGDGPLTSAVWKPTNYKFKVWMPAAKGSAQQARMVESALTVGVSAGRFPPLATYWDWRHWKIDVPDGWSRYASGGQDPAQSALIYFERDEDSPERVAVAMLPAGAMTSDELARKVKDELPTQYDVLKSVAMWPTSYGGDAADWLAFQGIDRAQPDVLTQSDVLVFVHGGRGYVISARTPASRYAGSRRAVI